MAAVYAHIILYIIQDYMCIHCCHNNYVCVVIQCDMSLRSLEEQCHAHNMFPV